MEQVVVESKRDKISADKSAEFGHVKKEESVKNLIKKITSSLTKSANVRADILLRTNIKKRIQQTTEIPPQVINNCIDNANQTCQKSPAQLLSSKSYNSFNSH